MDFAAGQEKVPKDKMENQRENEPFSSRERNDVTTEACCMSPADHYGPQVLVFK